MADGTSIWYRCPSCAAALGGEVLRCGACGKSWRGVTVGPTRITDFLDVCLPGGCRCAEGQGDQVCQVDLDALRTPPDTAGRPYHHKSKVLRPFLSWRGKVILDAGCREGPIGHLLAAGNRVIGVDVCPKGMLTGSPNALDKGYSQLLIADASNLPLADAQADMVIATDILEHALVPEKFLCEFHRVLKPGGVLVVTVPNLVSYSNRMSILFGSGVGIEPHLLLKGRSPVNPISGLRYPDQRLHVRFFTGRSLAGLLGRCGFEVLRRRGYDPVLSRIPLGDRLLRNCCQLAAVTARKPSG